MLLNDKKIKELKLISEPVGEHYQPGGYDVTIGEIIDADGGNIGTEYFLIPPQGIVWVVSQETIVLPKNVLSYATVRTFLTNEGLLALNIGIIDPLWSGPVATSLVNFGDSTVRVKKGEKFLRLTFHLMEEPEKEMKTVKDRGEYISKTQDRARKHFGSSFLNISKNLERIQRKAFVSSLPVFSLALAAIAIFVGVFASFITITMTYYITKDPSRDISQALSDSDRLTEYVLSTAGDDNAARRDFARRILAMEASVKRIECEAASNAATGKIDQKKLAVADIADCVAEGTK